MPEYEVSRSEIDWEALVADADPDWQETPWVYDFGKGTRKFYSTDHTDSGVYDGS
jgi:hypothetical protein